MSLNKNNIYKNYSDLISDKEFDQIKNYLKVDMDYEDDLIKELLDSAALILIDAIDSSKQPVDFSEEPRFQLAVKKQVKEEYEHRGLSSDSMRHKLANGLENIIHQLRVKVAMQSDHT